MWYAGAIRDDEWTPWAKHEKLHMFDGADCSRGSSWSTDRDESIGESSLPRPFVPFFESVLGNAALISSHHQCMPYSLSSVSPQSIRVLGTPNFQDQQRRSSEYQFPPRVLIRQLKECRGEGGEISHGILETFC